MKKLNLKIFVPIIVVVIVVIVGIFIIKGNSYNFLTNTKWKSLNGTQILKFNKNKTGTTNDSNFSWEESDGIITIKYTSGTIIHLKYENENEIEKIYNLNDTNIHSDVYTCVNSKDYDKIKNKITNQAVELDVLNIYHSTNTAQVKKQYDGNYYKYTAEVTAVADKYCYVKNTGRANDYIMVFLPTEELATLKAGDTITVIGCFDVFDFDLKDAFLVENLRTVDMGKIIAK